MDQITFAVPKDKLDVAVLLDNGVRLEGAIFLEYSPQDLKIHHRVVAFLENGTMFFPLKVKGGNTTEFIQKKNIKLLELTFGSEQEQGDVALSLMHIEKITAIFTDESSISGVLMAEVPLEKARLSDCLNLSDGFLHVKAGDTICYINKDKLRRVVYAD